MVFNMARDIQVTVNLNNSEMDKLKFDAETKGQRLGALCRMYIMEGVNRSIRRDISYEGYND